MPTTSYTLYSPQPWGRSAIASGYKDWKHSPKVNGKLILQSNPYEGFVAWVDEISGSPYVNPWGRELWPFTPEDAGSSPAPYDNSFTAVDNVAYAKWRGKLHKGGASMGVTLASWRQSSQLITGRLNHARRTLDSAYHGLLGNRNAVARLRKEREPLANQVLETEFGWRPLFEDVHAALYTVCQADLPSNWVASRHQEPFAVTVVSDKSHGNVQVSQYTGTRQTSYGAKVRVVNPNTWLLNRLGLINPATVAWDLVPWSFLVNGFVNINALLSSLTDTVGLDVTGHCITRSWTATRQYTRRNPDLYPGAYARSSVSGRYKKRVLGIPLKPVLEVKVPKLDWETALIASSLLIQKAERINKLIRAI